MQICGQQKEKIISRKKVLREKLNVLEEQLGNNRRDDTTNEYYACKERISQIEEIEAQGAIIRSRVKMVGRG